MIDQFHKYFYKDYHFWTLIIAFITMLSVGFFSYQAHQTQKALKSIEATREKEKISNNLKIDFNIQPSASYKLEEAEYNLKIQNTSSHIFERLETEVKIYFQDPETKKIVHDTAFTYPKSDILPSDKPIDLQENPGLTNTFQYNIFEIRKKKIQQIFEPKYFCCIFHWQVEIAKEEYLEIEKHHNFFVEGFK